MAIDIYAGIEKVKYLTDPKSVQVKYRPVWVYRRKHGNVPDVPTTDKTSFEFIWWKEQIRRCMYGWVCPDDGKFINGYHYFYLNFTKVKYSIPWVNTAQDVEEWDYPLYRDNDAIIFGILWNNRSGIKPNGDKISAKSHIEGKGRRKGWTTLLYGVYLHDFVFGGRGVVIGCGFPAEKTRDQERSDFKNSYGYLDPIFKKWEGAELVVAKDNETEFSIGEKISHNMYKIHATYLFAMVGSKDTTDVLRGRKMRRIGVSEAGMWKGSTLMKFINANTESLGLGDMKFGSFIVGGTSDAIENDSTDYRNLFINHTRHSFTRHFTPAYMVFGSDINYFTGKSDTETAKRKVLAARKILEGDDRNLKQAILENPIEWKEAFDPSQDGIYDHNLINKYITEIKELKRDRMWRRFKLEFDYDFKLGRINRKKVVAVYDPNGPWHIDTTCPVGNNNKFDNLYAMGIDEKRLGMDEGKKLTSKDSRNCAIVWMRDAPGLKIPSNKPAAMYYDALPNPRDTCEEFLKGMIYFNIGHSDVLVEYIHNTLEFHLQQEGESHRLYYTAKNRPGYKVSNDTQKDELTLIAKEQILNGILRNVDYDIILEDLKGWRLRNTDIASALHMVWYLLFHLKSHDMLTANAAANNYSTNYFNPELLRQMKTGNDNGFIQPWKRH